MSISGNLVKFYNELLGLFLKLMKWSFAQEIEFLIWTLLESLNQKKFEVKVEETIKI